MNREIEKRLPPIDASWRKAIRTMTAEVLRGVQVAKQKGFDLSSELRELAAAANTGVDDTFKRGMKF